MEQQVDGSFITQTVSDAVSGASIVKPADLDGDGDLDIVSGAGGLDWFENLGDGTFLNHVIPVGVTSHVSLAVEDMDNDGDLDIVSGAYWSHDVNWYENDGSESFTEHLVHTEINTPNG